MEDIQDELKILRKEVKDLREDIRHLIITCGRMDSHISFVDTVYDRIRNPMQTILGGFYSGPDMPKKQLKVCE